MLLRAVKPLLAHARGAPQQMPPEFWESRNAQIAHIVTERLDDRIMPVLDKQTEILEAMVAGINELVILQRDERIRKAAAGRG